MFKYLLPEVEPFLLLQKPGLDIAKSYNVTNDYGTPNIRFSYYTPFIPDEKKEGLATVQDELQSWNAWELAFAEDQLQKQLAKGKLPTEPVVKTATARRGFYWCLLATLYVEPRYVFRVVHIFMSWQLIKPIKKHCFTPDLTRYTNKLMHPGSTHMLLLEYYIILIEFPYVNLAGIMNRGPQQMPP